MDTGLQDSGSLPTDPNDIGPAEVPVLIVGGGPVGLTLSLLLSYHGIRSLLAEQHPGTSTYPKARLLKTRALEIFRQLDLEEAVHQIAIPHTRNLVVAHSLAGEDLHRRTIETVVPEFVRDWSPTWGMTTTQDAIEPVLFAHARQNGLAQFRFSTQLASFEHHDDAVLATLVHRPTGRIQRVRTRYLVGADGAHSTVREALGIPMLGRSILDHHVNILFRADLSRWNGDREINIAIIANSDALGLLLYNGGDRWRFTAYYDPDNGQRPEDFTPERCLQLVRSAVGVPDLAVDLGEISPWHDSALVAERFHDGRVFLAGDAEHVMSPMGGLALNVGIEDAHNLAWKLAAVLKSWASPSLLETYQPERLPVSGRITENSARNAGSMHTTLTETAKSASGHLAWVRPEMGREHGLVFGTSYASSAIVPDGSAPVQVSNPITDYVPNSRPGSRAPHVWLDRNGERLSTLDLFGHGFVLLTGVAGEAWRTAAREITDTPRVPLTIYSIGSGCDLVSSDDILNTTYGIDRAGAVLVRPDGYVAWRSRSASTDARRALDHALGAAVGNPVDVATSVAASG